MKRTSLPVLIVGWLFVAVGIGVLIATVVRYHPAHADDAIYAALSAVIAVVGGTWTIRGTRWARWVLIFWLVAHVVLSALHDMHAPIVHAALCVVITWMLLRRPPAA